MGVWSAHLPTAGPPRSLPARWASWDRLHINHPHPIPCLRAALGRGEPQVGGLDFTPSRCRRAGQGPHAQALPLLPSLAGGAQAGEPGSRGARVGSEQLPEGGAGRAMGSAWPQPRAHVCSAVAKAPGAVRPSSAAPPQSP